MGLDIGAVIPLFNQLADYNPDAFVRAFVYGSDGNPISGSPFNLLPVDLSGLYSNVTALMPSLPWVIAKYAVFEDSGYTILSSSEGGCSETFYLNPNAGGSFPLTNNIIGVVDDTENQDSPCPCPSPILKTSIIQGTDRILSVRLLDVNLLPFDLTLATLVEFRFRKTDGTILSVKNTDSGTPVVIVDPPVLGQLTCRLTATQTALLAPRIPAPFTIVITLSTGIVAVNIDTQLAVLEKEV